MAAVTLANLGSVLQLQGKWTEAEGAYKMALGFFAEVGNLHGRAQALGNLGTLYLNNDQVEKALECFVQDLDLNQRLGDYASQAQTLNNLAIAYRHLGRFDDALKCYEHSLTLKRELSDRHGELVTLINLYHLQQERGDLAIAGHYLGEARVLAQELGDSERLAHIKRLEAELASQRYGTRSLPAGVHSPPIGRR